ncbi:MAG: 1-deoxy-D-xylulose-5-phosphate reductoisomerase [Succinivibrio sp.]|nr:1-deoxy-D-xylulose-5-phosphate reductoisomerase [Succinivibrio sp.]
MLTLSILGATGSIGSSTLKVVRLHPQDFKIHALSCATSVSKMLSLCEEFRPSRVALSDHKAASSLASELKERGLKIEVLSGESGIEELAGDGEADLVIDAIVGAAGLRPVLKAVRAGTDIGLANKEALVMSGRLFFDEVKRHQVRVLPIDSEHSAIFQCLPEALQNNIGFCELKAYGVSRILLTGSGGPFRTTALDKLEHVTVREALAHPVWAMGPKITIDSSTMMNKGLEFIEARYLFNAGAEDIEVLIHPQSVVHSMVSYIDGAVLAQLGRPDMCTPIARALGYPLRLDSGVGALDFTALSNLSFEHPDYARYPCLRLAMQASAAGQGATTMLNAANEVAVQAFLDGRLKYLQIASVVSEVLARGCDGPVYSLEEIMDADRRARELATLALEHFHA